MFEDSINRRFVAFKKKDEWKFEKDFFADVMTVLPMESY